MNQKLAITLIFFCLTLNLSNAQRTQSWQVEKMPNADVDSLYQGLLNLCDSLDDNFFTITSPHFEFIHIYRTIDEEKSKTVIKIYRYNQDSVQTFYELPEHPFDPSDKQPYRFSKPFTHVYNQDINEEAYQRYQQFLKLNHELPLGKWYERPLRGKEEGLPERYSLVFLIRRNNSKVDMAIASVNNGRFIIYSDTEPNHPPFVIKKWQTLLRL